MSFKQLKKNYSSSSNFFLLQNSKKMVGKLPQAEGRGDVKVLALGPILALSGPRNPRNIGQYLALDQLLGSNKFRHGYFFDETMTSNNECTETNKY